MKIRDRRDLPIISSGERQRRERETRETDLVEDENVGSSLQKIASASLLEMKGKGLRSGGEVAGGVEGTAGGVD